MKKNSQGLGRTPKVPSELYHTQFANESTGAARGKYTLASRPRTTVIYPVYGERSMGTRGRRPSRAPACIYVLCTAKSCEQNEQYGGGACSGSTQFAGNAHNSRSLNVRARDK